MLPLAENICEIFIKLIVLLKPKSICFKFVQPKKVLYKLVTLLVLNGDISIYVREVQLSNNASIASYDVNGAVEKTEVFTAVKLVQFIKNPVILEAELKFKLEISIVTNELQPAKK